MLSKLVNGFLSLKALIYLKLLHPKNITVKLSDRFRKNFYYTITPNAKIVIGKHVFFNNNCSINSRCKVIIKDNVIMGEGVKIYDHNHRFNRMDIPIVKQGFSCKPVIIGENCWIGSNVTILKGVEIGNNSVIGAGTVLRKSVPDNVIVTSKEQLDINSIKYRY